MNFEVLMYSRVPLALLGSDICLGRQFSNSTYIKNCLLSTVKYKFLKMHSFGFGLLEKNKDHMNGPNKSEVAS